MENRNFSFLFVFKGAVSFFLNNHILMTFGKKYEKEHLFERVREPDGSHYLKWGCRGLLYPTYVYM